MRAFLIDQRSFVLRCFIFMSNYCDTAVIFNNLDVQVLLRFNARSRGTVLGRNSTVAFANNMINIPANNPGWLWKFAPTGVNRPPLSFRFALGPTVKNILNDAKSATPTLSALGERTFSRYIGVRFVVTGLDF